MIIESIDVRRFGKLIDFKASFEAGFNLIEGPAESGKTTLAAFITYMLYGFPVETGAPFTERMHRTPWQGTTAAGSMVFSAGAARYRIERTSERTERGWRDSYTLLNLDTGLAEQGEKAPGEIFLGVPRETFLDTAFLNDIRRGAPDEAHTTEAIENILFSGAERISSARALCAITEAENGILSADGKSGDIAVLEKERAILASQLEEASAIERTHFEREEELYLTRKKMDEARAEIDKFSRRETDYYNALMIEDYDRLHALEDASEARVQAIKSHEASYRVGEFLPDRAYISEILSREAEVSACKTEASEAETAFVRLPEGKDVVESVMKSIMEDVDAAGGEDSLRTAAKEYLKKRRFFFGIGTLVTLLFLACAVFFFRAVVVGSLTLLFGIGSLILLGGTVLLLVEGARAHRALHTHYAAAHADRLDEFLFHLQGVSEARISMAHATEEKERGAIRLARAKERLTIAVKELTDSLSRFGVQPESADSPECAVAGTVARAEEYLRENDRLVAEHRAAESEVRALREKLTGDNEVAVRARVAPEYRRRFRNQNAKDLRRGVELYTERLDALSKTERALTDALAAERRGESLPAIAERILAIDGRIRVLRERAEALALARTAVAGGAERLRAEIAPRLGLDACRFLYEMTDGKYSDIRVADNLTLAFDEGGGARTVDYLSHSTEDLTYYALRLALIDLLYHELPPVSFDGCTARQDDDRALSFLRAVRTLTEEGKQCFFFASGARECGLASRVFSAYRRVKMPV